MKSATRPAFVFVDDGPLWHSFHQVAALVRRRGYQTVRVTTAPTGRLGRLIDRLLYDRAFYLPGVAGLARLPEALAQLNVSQLYASEAVLGAVGDDVLSVLPEETAAELQLRIRYSDKMQAAALAAELGVPVPDQIPASAGASYAVEQLGLPLMVKTKMGAAGSGVRIAGSRADVERSLAELGSTDNLYFERFVDGPVVCYAAFVAKEGIVQEITYKSVQAAPEATKAPLAYEVIDDPELRDAGRRVCERVGLRGPINMQSIRDPDGNDWMIDLNLRPFGGMLCYDQSEIDTVAGYLNAAGFTNRTPIHRNAPTGARVAEFPLDVEVLARQRRYLAALRTYLRRSRSFRQVLGTNYIAFAALNGAACKLGA